MFEFSTHEWLAAILIIAFSTFVVGLLSGIKSVVSDRGFSIESSTLSYEFLLKTPVVSVRFDDVRIEGGVLLFFRDGLLIASSTMNRNFCDPTIEYIRGKTGMEVRPI